MENAEKQSSSKNIWFVAALLLFLVLVVVAGVWAWQRFAGQESSGKQATSAAKPATKTAEIVSIDATWKKYINNQLGFSIKIPREVLHGYGSCKYVNTGGDHSYRPVRTNVPTTVFEEGNTVYITSLYFYKLGGKTKDTKGVSDYYYFSSCDKTTNSVAELKDPDSYYHQVWSITVRKNVKNDSEVLDIIKAGFGTGCLIGTKTPSGQNGVYDIEIGGGDFGSENSKCPINYAYVLKYYPDKNVLASWVTGQACTFCADGDVCHDEEMIDSFRFLDN